MKVQINKKKWAFFLLSGLFPFIILACSKKNAQENAPLPKQNDLQSQNKIILKIGDTFHSSSDFEKYVRFIIGNDFETLDSTSLSRLFDKFIEEKILLYTAQNQKISITPEEEQAYLAKLANEPWSEDEKKSLVESDPQSVLNKLMVEKYIFQLVKNIEVEEKEIDAYYKLHKKDFFEPERVKVSQILLDTEVKAIEILGKVKNYSEENFRNIAQAESKGPEASKGGEVGLFAAGQLPYEIEKVVFSLKEGEISPVVESTYGFHIFRVDRIDEPELLSREKAAPAIRIKILDQKIEQLLSSHIEELKTNIEWTSYPQNLNFVYERNN